MIDVGAPAVSGDGELVLSEAIGEPPAIGLEGRTAAEHQLLLAGPERRLRGGVQHGAADQGPHRARVGSDDADEADLKIPDARYLAGGRLHQARRNLVTEQEPAEKLDIDLGRRVVDRHPTLELGV